MEGRVWGLGFRRVQFVVLFKVYMLGVGLLDTSCIAGTPNHTGVPQDRV